MDVPGTSHDWVSVADACERTGYSRSHMHRLIGEQRIESETVQVGGSIEYRVCLRHFTKPSRGRPHSKQPPSSPIASPVTSSPAPETSPGRYLDIIEEQARATVDLYGRLSEALTENGRLREDLGTYRERAADLERQLAAERARREQAEAQVRERRWYDPRTW